MILGIAPGAMGFLACTQASISHRVRAERRCAEIISLATAGARLAALFQIPFSGRRKAPERANVILTVSRAHGKRHLVCRSAPAGACRGQPGASPALGPQAGFRGHRSDALKKTQIRQLLALEFVFFSGTEGAGFASGAPK